MDIEGQSTNSFDDQADGYANFPRYFSSILRLGNFVDFNPVIGSVGSGPEGVPTFDINAVGLGTSNYGLQLLVELLIGCCLCFADWFFLWMLEYSGLSCGQNPSREGRTSYASG